MTRPTREDLAAWAEVEKAATPGPWFFITTNTKPKGLIGTMVGAVAPGHQIRTEAGGGTYPSADGKFIAAARDALPRLLAYVADLERERDEARDRLRAIGEYEDLRAGEGEWTPYATLAIELAEVTRERDRLRALLQDGVSGTTTWDEWMSDAQAALRPAEQASHRQEGG